MATVTFSFSAKILTLPYQPKTPISNFYPVTNLRLPSSILTQTRNGNRIRASLDGDFSAKRNSSNSDQRETIMLPGCDYNHWLIVMEFPKDPAPTREQMIDTYLDTLATVLGSMEEAKKNMYAFSTTTYTGFQCTVDEATSEKFKGNASVPNFSGSSYLIYACRFTRGSLGDKYVNGEIIPCKYPTYQPKRSAPKNESRRYERRRDGPPPERRRPRQEAAASDSSST
ncbi:hypothetical protein V8G54_033324 [Vigna mungo]|uniref:MORF/ORRM1/DAG-like MORF domain-containing protein n=1 Tax=Vigna mungo TaxID=3915 RepID=A0AAQ3MNT4_VIGMU